MVKVELRPSGTPMVVGALAPIYIEFESEQQRVTTAAASVCAAGKVRGADKRCPWEGGFCSSGWRMKMFHVEINVLNRCALCLWHSDNLILLLLFCFILKVFLGEGKGFLTFKTKELEKNALFSFWCKNNFFCCCC